MDPIAGLQLGFSHALTATNLGWALLGCFLGTAVGVLPGIGPALTIALLLPVTFQVEATGAFILFCGIFYGAMYGGSTTSILLNTPGESGSIITALEGAKMARSGRAGPALATAAIGSFIAGTIGTLGISFLGPIVVELALKLGPAEYFSLMLLCFVTVSAVLGGSALRGLTSLFLGLLLGLIGIDLQTGQPRMTLGVPELLDGVNVVLVAVALFAVGETLFLAWRHVEGSRQVRAVGRIMMSRADWRRSLGPWFRGSLLGFPFGVMPAGGTEMPTMLSYYTERKLAPPEAQQEFGTTGAIEGVAGPEAANNAAAAGVLVPMLTLGLPTSATAAIMLSAFQSYGINPGPLLFEQQGALVWTLIASLYVANVMLVVLNLPLVGLWARILKIPQPQLYAGILVFATIGTYGISNSVTDLVLLYGIGVIGMFMRRFDFPTAPVVIGMILGPMAEQAMRQALTISQGDWTTFVTRPVSLAILLLAVAALAVPRIYGAWMRRPVPGPG
ncbi:tripartite tricarboxylate transporter TctA [Siccirubricoccus deserti]|uniref:Tripartite tricarboxylate transporter permease n=1 Tax=Siccirubricoccus deserti TaxID=2013562 RepID=A0A9X0QWB9_9PROT|nr:tripartite tricarboxylate transporter permease [Siccirubricoccus deserti]MBC4014088.1 tripartite tricarboxylate transporter permease [Siccirubricoccus deserti]GGC26334.1 tripartite tricarboxylate transporter TctA [Siccirubricoccus deserti]